MEDRIIAIRYNAEKLETIKRAINFILLLSVMIYALFQNGFKLNKENSFMLAFFGFLFFVLAVGLAGYKKEKFRNLSTSGWKYRLYKNTNAFVYFIVRGIITSLIFTVLFFLFQLRSSDYDAVMQKINIFVTGFFVFVLIAGAYHLLTMIFIVRTGTPIKDMFEE